MLKRQLNCQWKHKSTAPNTAIYDYKRLTRVSDRYAASDWFHQLVTVEALRCTARSRLQINPFTLSRSSCARLPAAAPGPQFPRFALWDPFSPANPGETIVLF
ncbi:hypothetical protein J6590_056775 [Homalodisca vitripennis]|nr:hypothetical protein J6590_056775 [Homalodisca vitripennis]